MKKTIIIINYWKTLVITFIILHLSFAPPSEFSRIPTFENEDKLIHFLMYFALTAVLIHDTLRASRKQELNTKMVLRFCLIFSVILGGVIEIMQPLFFAPRTASWYDWLADTLGVVAAWFLMKWIFAKKYPDFFRKDAH